MNQKFLQTIELQELQQLSAIASIFGKKLSSIFKNSTDIGAKFKAKLRENDTFDEALLYGDVIRADVEKYHDVDRGHPDYDKVERDRATNCIKLSDIYAEAVCDLSSLNDDGEMAFAGEIPIKDLVPVVGSSEVVNTLFYRLEATNLARLFIPKPI